MLRATFRNLAARRLRLALSGLAVVLGVAFVSGTLVLTDTVSRLYDMLFSTVERNTAVAVRARTAFTGQNNLQAANRAPVPVSLLPKLAAVDGVRAAAGTVDGYAQIVDPKTKKAVSNGGAPAQGTNWVSGPLASSEIAGGTAPRGDGEVVVDKQTFTDHHLTVGGQVLVLTQKSPALYRISGYFTVGGQASLGGATVVAFDTPRAQQVLLTPDTFSTIILAADKGLSQDQLRARVAPVLPKADEAITGTALANESAGAVQSGISVFSYVLLAFAGISLVVGAFIIFNTFSMLVGQRVQELALLRALGASRRQITRSVLVEAVVVGVIGASAGLGIGVLLAIGLKAAIGSFGVAPGGALVFRLRTVLAAYLVGVVITALAAYLPARRAATVPPVAAMRDSFTLPARSLRRRGQIGVTMLLAGVAAIAVGLVQGGDNAVITVGIGSGLCFFAVAVVSPLVSRPVTGALGAPLPRLFGMTGRIARENAMRNPRRTATTANALMVGLTLVSLFAVISQSIKLSFRDTISSSVGADYILTAGQYFQPFTPQVAAKVATVPGVSAVTGLQAGRVQVDGTSAGVTAGAPAALPAVLALRQVEGSLTALRAGGILVSQDVADARGFRVGQRLRVVFQQTGPTTLTVAGTYAKNEIAGAYLISLSEYDKHITGALDSLVLVKRAAGADADTTLKAVARAVAGYPNIDVRSQTQFVDTQTKQLDQLLTFVYVLLALAIVIAVLGIVNTLALSVIERTREIGLLRAVGMNRAQLRRTIQLESVVIAVFGAVLGVVLGSLLGWALVTSLSSRGLTTFGYPVSTVVAVLVGSGILGVLAALLPARRAARMDVLRAISVA